VGAPRSPQGLSETNPVLTASYPIQGDSSVETGFWYLCEQHLRSMIDFARLRVIVDLPAQVRGGRRA
jgi:hypothetical protein